MSLMSHPWAYSRLFCQLLTVVAQTAPPALCPLPVHQPEMGITRNNVPRKDTGGERRFLLPPGL